MNKLFLTSIAALSIATSAFADNVQPNIAPNAESANCTESVLETTSGTSNLQANWTANTLHLSWSVDGSPYATNDSNASTCTYDQGITIPTNPSKTGYTFAGWQVRNTLPQCGINNWVFGGQETLVDFGSNEGGSVYPSSNIEKYNLVNNGDWAMEFSNGIIKGVANCNTTPSNTTNTVYTQLENEEITFEEAFALIYGSSSSDAIRSSDSFNQSSTGSNCWCRITNFNGNECSETLWVAVGDMGNNCVDQCSAEGCINIFFYYPDFRNALLGKSN